MRKVLLASAQNQWLRERAPKYRFIRRAVTRFMPGEDVQDALTAARALQEKRISSILTHLGENLTDAAEATAVTRHYLQVLDLAHQQSLAAVISIKPTQLGLDLDANQCLQNLRTLLEHARQLGNFVWIDMEGTAYTDATLDLFRRVRPDFTNVGVALQAYLYRTAKDLAELLPLRPAIRLVKGAYNEPPNLAYPRKKDVDENFFRLAQQMLAPEARQSPALPAFGTHDLRLIQRLERAIEEGGIAKTEIEFQLLYGIQRAEQVRLTEAGYRVRVLISYGAQWFPWFMRRLAERPANLGFVMRNLFS